MTVEKNQFDEGVKRVSSLLALYENLQKEGSTRKSKEKSRRISCAQLSFCFIRRKRTIFVTYSFTGIP